jgi:hypothetical protein
MTTDNSDPAYIQWAVNTLPQIASSVGEFASAGISKPLHFIHFTVAYLHSDTRMHGAPFPFVETTGAAAAVLSGSAALVFTPSGSVAPETPAAPPSATPLPCGTQTAGPSQSQPLSPPVPESPSSTHACPSTGVAGSSPTPSRGGSSDSLFSSWESDFSSEDDDAPGIVLVASTPPPSDTCLDSPPPYESSTPPPSQLRRATLGSHRGVSSALSSDGQDTHFSAAWSSPTPVPVTTDDDSDDTTPKMDRYQSSSKGHAPTAADNDAFIINPAILPVNPIKQLAWKGMTNERVTQYIDDALKPSSSSQLTVHPSGLGGGSAAEEMVFVRTPHAGIGRGAGAQVQSIETGRITQASGSRARVLSIMPEAGVAVVAYMKQGEVRVHSAFSDDVNEDEHQPPGTSTSTTPPAAC